ncbi:hypothetical protein QF117_20380 [Vibrio sp. YMD68]|uniref:hypothetical protein n=1 Tax=Vibrio sp. YMD68 TaxID=3042300 RepID=UPI00249B8518|nr:hypothetical protein [Vibrio sp. YMD68]WGW00203.1 hypothetical protein QF117_20380 [Vibrio sp. YMD68]
MEFFRLVNIKKNNDCKEEFIKSLSVCEKHEIPLYYILPTGYHLWQFISWSQEDIKGKSGGHNLTIEKGVSEQAKYIIKLKKDDIANILTWESAAFIHCSKVAILTGRDFEVLPKESAFNKWMRAEDIREYLNTPGLIKSKRLPKEEDYQNKNHPIEYFYFKKISLKNKCENFEPEIIEFEFNNILVLNEDISKVSSLHQIPQLSEIPENSPYYIPDYYRSYNSLCKLARIGFGIFEVKTIPKPPTVRDGGFLLEEYGLFRRKNTPPKSPKKPSKNAESGYAFINAEFGKGRGKSKPENQRVNPQIQHLFPPLEKRDSYSAVKSQVQSLEHSEDMEAFALALMKNKF